VLSIFNLSGGTAQSGRSHCSIQAEPLLNFAGRADFAERRTQLLSGYDKLQQNGQLNVQIWELPAFDNKSVFVVIWTEA